MNPAFIITIDTEGDNLWSRAGQVTTINSRFLDRFQRLCESHGFKPTYLTNYEMANCEVFEEFAKDVLRRKAGEVGMHLHAWDTPPVYLLTDNDKIHHPYLIEYPEHIIREKVTIMTELLEEKFGVKMISHRAGRWSFNEIYARILVEKGYRVDCSVTPHVSWKAYLGDVKGHGGTDYTNFPERAYFLDLDDISKPGDSPLLEIPVTIKYSPNENILRLKSRVAGFKYLSKAMNLIFPTDPVWFRPNGKNRRAMIEVAKKAILGKSDVVEFMIHSSEFMPGGSPYFKSSWDVDNLFADLESIFSTMEGQFAGMTLCEYYFSFNNRVSRNY